MTSWLLHNEIMSLITFRGRQVSIPQEAYGLVLYAGVIQLSDLIKNILIRVPKMNEGLTGLKQHEGE